MSKYFFIILFLFFHQQFLLADEFHNIHGLHGGRAIGLGGAYAAISSSLALIGMLAGGLDEDKDKNKLASIRTLMYALNRLHLELAFFVNPSDTWKILQTPAASMSVVEQSAKTMISLLPWNWDEKYESGAHTGEYKLYRNLKREVPIWRQVERMYPDAIKEQLQFYN